jgi:ketosteroid isomerase-like protein
MSETAALIRRYVERFNASDVDGMLDCCWEDVVFETVSNPGGAMRFTGKAEMREVIAATTLAFSKRRQEITAILVDGERAAAETVFSGVAAADLGGGVQAGEHVVIRGATLFESRGGRLCRICDYS